MKAALVWILCYSRDGVAAAGVDPCEGGFSLDLGVGWTRLLLLQAAQEAVQRRPAHLRGRAARSRHAGGGKSRDWTMLDDSCE